jgi:hypothetical protein
MRYVGNVQIALTGRSVPASPLMHHLQGQFDSHDHAQHAPAIEALFLAEEHSGELRRMISS